MSQSRLGNSFFVRVQNCKPAPPSPLLRRSNHSLLRLEEALRHIPWHPNDKAPGSLVTSHNPAASQIKKWTQVARDELIVGMLGNLRECTGHF